MTPFQDAQATIMLADHVASDTKLNALGLGFSFCGLAPGGQTPPMSVAVIIDFPRKYAGTEISISLTLHDSTVGQIVQLAGPTGQVEALRLQQVVPIEAPQAHGVYLPPDFPPRVQMVMQFANGLPLVQAHNYEWQLEIDGQRRPGWTAKFHVLGPPPGPVFGGPTGPSDTADLPKLNP